MSLNEFMNIKDLGNKSNKQIKKMVAQHRAQERTCCRPECDGNLKHDHINYVRGKSVSVYRCEKCGSSEMH